MRTVLLAFTTMLQFSKGPLLKIKCSCVKGAYKCLQFSTSMDKHIVFQQPTVVVVQMLYFYFFIFEGCNILGLAYYQNYEVCLLLSPCGEDIWRRQHAERTSQFQEQVQLSHVSPTVHWFCIICCLIARRTNLVVLGVGLAIPHESNCPLVLYYLLFGGVFFQAQ